MLPWSTAKQTKRGKEMDQVLLSNIMNKSPMVYDNFYKSKGEMEAFVENFPKSIAVDIGNYLIVLCKKIDIDTAGVDMSMNTLAEKIHAKLSIYEKEMRYNTYRVHQIIYECMVMVIHASIPYNSKRKHVKQLTMKNLSDIDYDSMSSVSRPDERDRHRGRYRYNEYEDSRSEMSGPRDHRLGKRVFVIPE